ncbi:hypothetical protein [Sphingomonas montanisoli]|uniref:Uncharacterized protein n=1 Tax=Sphingomonas montanisoli TaxID=2606412 RepID=A0A5D9BYA0_9SPHN|nr:hypothetical protein [Sphingomonas montanisoli]TZG24183.1 hypothetical protein FYJ91_20360 [Sphingomonas montanisoli]
MMMPPAIMIDCPTCDLPVPILRARYGATPRQPLAPATLDDGSDPALSIAIDKVKGRKLGGRQAGEQKQANLSRSSVVIGYGFDASESGRLWLSARMIGESRRRAVPMAGGRKLVSGTASVGAGWVHDDHWQLSAHYQLAIDDSKWSGAQRGIELASGGRPTGSAMIAAIAYSPDFGQAQSMRIGIEARHGRITADDAQAMASTRRDRQTIALTLATGF